MTRAIRDDRSYWGPGSVRLFRDIAAAAIAAGLAAVAVMHVASDPPRTGPQPLGKATDRLTWTTEDVPTRATAVYDTVAMFALPQTEPSPWSEPDRSTVAAAVPEPAEVKPHAAPRLPSMAESTTQRRLAVAVLPPSRPVAPVRPAAAQDVAARPVVEPPRPIALLGWTIPGSEHLPDPQETFRRVASIGGTVASLGDTIAETVGLR